VSAKSKAGAPAGGFNLRLFYGTLVAIAVIGIGWIAWSASGRGTPAVAPIDLSGIDDNQALLQQARGMQLGPDGAPVPILVFSDFTCPGCMAFAQYIEPQIKAEFVNDGRVRYVYYDFPLGGEAGHRHGFLASRAARCAADQGKFWEYHDVLFARQGEWASARNAPVSLLMDYAGLLALDESAFGSCLKSDTHADVVTANKILGERLGVGATPTVFIGSRSIPAGLSYEEVRSLIQRELGEAGS
jgi:protein-disulfide isomerase